MLRCRALALSAAAGGAGGGEQLSPAASELAARLQSKVAQRRDPAQARKLIDRLKDHQLAGHWAKAVSIFDNFSPESRQWRWQTYHYRCLLQVLTASKQTEPLPRVWAGMTARPELAIDVESANDALVLAATIPVPEAASGEGSSPAAGSSGDLATDIEKYMRDAGLEVKFRASRALEQRRASDWRAALEAVARRVDLHRLEQPAGTPLPDEIAAALNRLAGRHRRNPGAVAAITAGMAAAGVAQDGDAYAARIRACNANWVDALGIMDECGAAGVRPTTHTYKELLACLWAAHQVPRMRPVVDAMLAAGVAQNKATLELAMKYYGTTTQWQEATAHFLALKAAGVPPTNGGYGALIKAYNRGGQAARVMPVFEAMRKDGFQGDAKDAVSLINAWSHNRMGRMRNQRR